MCILRPVPHPSPLQDLEVAAEERREAAKIAREAEDSDGDGEDYVFEHVSEEDLRKVSGSPGALVCCLLARLPLPVPAGSPAPPRGAR